MIAMIVTPERGPRRFTTRVRGMPDIPHIFFYCILLLALPPFAEARGETVYRSEDAQGNVTYSTVPSVNAVESHPLTVMPEPSAADQQEALQRQRQLQRAADRLSTQEEARHKTVDVRVAEAEQALLQARSHLEEARVKQDSDWQWRAGGRHPEGNYPTRYLKPQYYTRVKAAEDAVRLAEEDLAKARRNAR